MLKVINNFFSSTCGLNLNRTLKQIGHPGSSIYRLIGRLMGLNLPDKSFFIRNIPFLFFYARKKRYKLVIYR
jgi:hypothetical protein